MIQQNQAVRVVAGGDPTRFPRVRVSSVTQGRHPQLRQVTDARAQAVVIVAGGDPTRFPLVVGIS